MGWCYVSHECSHSDYGKDLNTKSCSEGSEDKKFGDMKFVEFAKYVYQSKLELGLALQYAYPVAPVKLPDVLEFWGLDDRWSELAGKALLPMPSELKHALSKRADTEKPLFFNPRTGHPPFAVMKGRKLYWINFSDAYKG